MDKQVGEESSTLGDPSIMPLTSRSPHSSHGSDGRSSHGHGRRRGAADSDRFRALFFAIAAMTVGLATVGLPSHGMWLGAKALVLEVVAIIVAMVIVSNGDWSRERVKAALTAPVNIVLMAFLAWVALSAALSPMPKYSSYEAMRHLGGALLYFCIVYGPSIRRHLSDYTLVLSVTGILAAFTSLLSITNTTDLTIAGSYKNIQLLASVLGVLLPIVWLTSRCDDNGMRKMIALSSSGFLLVGVLVLQNRSIWLGCGVAMPVLLFLYIKHIFLKRNRIDRSTIIVPALVLVLLIGVFFAFSNRPEVILSRFESVKALDSDKTLNWRKGMWNKAFRMIARKPVMGWGVGTFPVNQALFYHPDVLPHRSQKVIVEGGPSLSENAHNTYLQLTAEMGFVGLGLFLTMFLTWFATAFRGLRELQPGLRSAVLIGCISSIIVMMVSAIGNPAWEFPECSLFYWTALGLGMACCGLGDRGRNLGKSRPKDSSHSSRNGRTNGEVPPIMADVHD